MKPTFYPPSPKNVPNDLTNPNKSFKKHIWLASSALILFIVTYIGISGWFLYKSFQLLRNAFSGGRETFPSLLGGVLLGFLGIFMVKALFFRTKRDEKDNLEITPEEHPDLFTFINEIADETKAPRPHKIFISNSVNACVFYELSVFNIIFPTKKNLEIGLGLVNTLNLAEFKSVMAHEFGHFGQKSMLIGRWVYVTHVIAQQIVTKRDAFDSFLRALSRVDIRIAWIGWLLSIIVWALRSIAETLFYLVMLTQRALSRQMEFHADLVAVSVSGSDAIVNALYKLQTADEAYARAIDFINKQLREKRAISDIYSIQSNYIKNMAVVLNNPSYGLSPQPDENDKGAYRVFKQQIAQAPKMWSTHPSNVDRETNAKTYYISSEPDERSPWLLFNNPKQLRSQFTQIIYSNLKTESLLSDEESISRHDAEFQRKFLQPAYRGIYLERPIFLNYTNVEELYQIGTEKNNNFKNFNDLYHESIQDELNILKGLEEEMLLLEGLRDKRLDTENKNIQYRGREVKHKELPQLIEEVRVAKSAQEEKIDAHHISSRNLHYTAAKKMGHGWDEYLLSLSRVLHYCEHSNKNIEKASHYFFDSLNQVSANRKVNESDISQILHAANTLCDTLSQVYQQTSKIRVNDKIQHRIGRTFPEDFLQEFKLGHASRENINEWIGVVGGWIDVTVQPLNILQEATLEELLEVEEYIRQQFEQPNEILSAPEKITLDNDFKRYNPNDNPQFYKNTEFFSSFMNGDSIIYNIGRFVIAASIILGGIFISASIGKSKIYIYNGLPVDVYVKLDDNKILVPHDEKYEKELNVGNSIEVETHTADGELVESFTASMSGGISGDYIYNVASAAAIYQYEITYSTSAYFQDNPDPHFKLIGAKRWIETNADYYFESPPSSISMKSGQTKTKVIISALQQHPSQIVNIIESEEERNELIRMQAKFVPHDSPYTIHWLTLASSLPDVDAIIKKRLSKNKFDVPTLRMEQDAYSGDEKKAVCQRQKKLYESQPNNGDLYYLYCRCMEEGPTQDMAFLDGYMQWKDNPWLAFSAGRIYSTQDQWDKALNCYMYIIDNAPQLQEAILEETKRICQLTGQQNILPSHIQELSPYVTYVNGVESSSELTAADDNYIYAYKLLALGNLAEAIQFSEPNPELQATIISLAALSDGATPQIIDQAIALDTSLSMGITNFAATLALHAKHKKSIEVFRPSLRQMLDNDADTLITFVKLVTKGDVSEADRILSKQNVSFKARYALIASSMLGNATPNKWQEYVDLLFITEKPYRKKLIP